MPKLKGPQNATPPSSQGPDSSAGPWGRINPTPQSAQTLRLRKRPSSTTEHSFSYPYRTLSSWTWRRDVQQEELKIEAGPDAITIRGKGLVRLVEALDVGALELVTETAPETRASLENAIIVDSLIVEDGAKSSRT